VAKRIYQNQPVRHVDIGSRTDGFVAHVAVFREIEIIDIRSVVSKVPNIKFIQADFMDPSPNLIDYTDSVSSLHAIEHFGLGRYNDPVDAYGHLKGLDNIYRVLKKGGKFYFSVPIGRQRIEFNGQRVFDVGYLMSQFAGKYRIDAFSFVDDRGDLHENVQLEPDDIAHNFGCHYGCGIFEMTKL
jgi:SAM-dependent methyltransferase